MGNSVGSVFSGVGQVVGNIFSHPLDFLSGKACNSVCAPTWDFICYIENFCVAQLLKFVMVAILAYFMLLFFYLLNLGRRKRKSNSENGNQIPYQTTPIHKLQLRGVIRGCRENERLRDHGHGIRARRGRRARQATDRAATVPGPARSKTRNGPRGSGSTVGTRRRLCREAEVTSRTPRDQLRGDATNGRTRR
ncbi:corepressor interacting with RBPJ 1 [Salvia divinorum]|uniref:Corepressor interacting with RBPJ 1 n=1 Tax=Salvia divinorum TaxID=28513 RepID=A0ABD1FQ04_SALDI